MIHIILHCWVSAEWPDKVSRAGSGEGCFVSPFGTPRRREMPVLADGGDDLSGFSHKLKLFRHVAFSDCCKHV